MLSISVAVEVIGLMTRAESSLSRVVLHRPLNLLSLVSVRRLRPTSTLVDVGVANGSN